MIKKCFLIVFFGLTVLIHADAKVTIYGSIIGAKGEVVRVFSASDLVSRQQQCIAYTVIRDDGTFSLDFEWSSTAPVWIDVAFYREKWVIEPGKSYHFTSERSFQFNPNTYEKQLGSIGLTLVGQHFSLINQHNWQIDSLYNDFMEREFVKVFRHKNTESVEKFNRLLSDKFTADSSQYIKVKIQCLTSELEYQSGLKSRAELQQILFADRPYYYHDEYVNVFNNILSQYFVSQQQVSWYGFNFALNSAEPVLAMLDTLGKDPLLKHEMVREVALLSILRQVYTSVPSVRQKVSEALNVFGHYTKFPYHAALAKALKKQIQVLHAGSPLPQIKPYYSAQNTKNDWLLTKKPIYILFAGSNCRSCIEDLDILAAFPEYILKQVDVRVIMLDRDSAAAQRFITQKPYPFRFIYSGNDPAYSEAFNVKGLPFEILADESGNIISYPAMRPGNELEHYFNQLILKSTQKKTRPRF